MSHSLVAEPAAATELIAALAPLSPEVTAARLAKPELIAQTQAAHDRLFADPGPLEPALRRALAARVAEQHGAPELAAYHREHGAADLAATEIDPVLGALVRHADLVSLSPALVTAANHLVLIEIGIDPDTVLALSQVVAFTSFQVRLLHGLSAISAGTSAPGGDTATADATESAATPVAELAAGRTKTQTAHAPNGRPAPAGYTTATLGWLPWVPPVPEDELTAEQTEAFAGKSSSEYFRLLARQPGVLTARTRIDHAIFLTRTGLPRAERELAAAVTSKVNDCVFCASVHARKAAQMSKRPADVDRLLAADVPRAPGWAPTDLTPLAAGQDQRWSAIIIFAAALARTPAAATAEQVLRLRDLGLDDADLADLVASVAFFSWANRLMLTLGEPYVPATSTATTTTNQGRS